MEINEGTLHVVDVDGVAPPHVQISCGKGIIVDSVATHENGRVGGLY